MKEKLEKIKALLLEVKVSAYAELDEKELESREDTESLDCIIEYLDAASEYIDDVLYQIKQLK